MTNLIHHATQKKADALGILLIQTRNQVSATNGTGQTYAVAENGKLALDAAIVKLAKADAMFDELNENPTDETEEDDEEPKASGSVVANSYRAEYAVNDQTCGDDIADALRAYANKEGKRTSVDYSKIREVGAANGIDIGKWAHLNNGMIRMNLSNVLRRMIRKGDVVTVGEQTWDLTAAMKVAVKDMGDTAEDNGELAWNVITTILESVGLPLNAANSNAVQALWSRMQKVGTE